MSTPKKINLSLDEPSKWTTFKWKVRWWIKDIIPWNWQEFYYHHIRTIFAPCHSRLRKVIPKYWWDVSSLIEIVNFEFIKCFYEEEYTAGIVDWQADKLHRDFSEWLESAYLYITKERPELEKQLSAAYPDLGENWWESYKTGDKSYDELYGEVNRLQDLIEKKDTKVITELVKRRAFFWT